jgi:hypothetical protein
MKKFKRFFSCFCLVIVMALTIVPGHRVYATDGPQGGSNSPAPKPPPPPPPPPPSTDWPAMIAWIMTMSLG